MKKAEIIQKLRKLHALVERGSPGERENAKVLLIRLLEKFDLTIDDFVDRKVWAKFPYRTVFEKDLLFQVTFKVTGDSTLTYVTEKNNMSLKLTESEQIEVKRLYAIYRKALKKEFETTFQAFIHKHWIFPKTPSDDNERKECTLSQEEIEKLVKAMAALDNILIYREIEAS